jgi:methionyl-tRNA formyltransferase
MGTPDFAVPALNALADDGNDLVLVVTQPDRPSGRGHHLTPTPVKKTAIGRGLPVVSPDRIKENDDLIAMFRALKPDLIVVAAYGKILPKTILDIPPRGCVNIHASLLPKYRGAAPIHRAVEAGESVTGVTLMYMSEGMDEGDIIAQKSVNVEGLNTGQVFDLLADLGAALLLENLEQIKDGTAPRIPQTAGAATYAAMIRKEEAHIDFSLSADAVVNRIRAMNPSPGAFAYLDGAAVKLREAHTGAGSDVTALHEAPGTVTAVSTAGIEIISGAGSVILDVIQLPGKKPMRIRDFLLGNKLEIGTRFS